MHEQQPGTRFVDIANAFHLPLTLLAMPAWPQDTLVVEERLLIEYAVGSIPVNPETVVDAVAKSIVTKELCGILEWDHALFEDKPPPPQQQEAPIRFTPISEIEKALAARIVSVSVQKLVNDIIDRKRGKA